DCGRVFRPAFGNIASRPCRLAISPRGQMRAVPGERLVHDLAERLATVDFVMADALEHDELLGLGGAREHRLALLRRHQAVVVRGYEQDWPRRDAVDHPFRIETERVVDE